MMMVVSKIKLKRIGFLLLFLLSLTFMMASQVYATDITDFNDMDVNIIDPNFMEDWFAEDLVYINIAGESVAASSAVQLLFLFTLISLGPTLLMMLTSFTRIIIVMHFMRSAMATQSMPPNQVLIGLALFLTFFIMGDKLVEVNETAFQPYTAGEITQAEALEIGMEPFRRFMLENVRWQDIALFAGLAGEELDTPADAPNRILIPAFILSEITLGFTFGFLVFIPFVVIDMVVATVLMAMGMMMLPPALISMPFKVLLFVLVDGWQLIINLLVGTFAGFG